LAIPDLACTVHSEQAVMKICIVTTGFPRWQGDGQCAFIWESAQAIARQGVQVRVVAMHAPGLSTRENMNGIEITRPRYWWPEQWEILRKEGAAGIPAALRKHPQGYLQILPLLLVHSWVASHCAKNCDVVHAHWTLSAAAVCLGRQIHNRPIVATVHGSDIFQVPRHPIGAWLTKIALRGCDQITAVSHALMEATAALGINPRKLQAISNGVDTNRFTPGPHNRENVVLYVGSFIKRKGVEHLLNAMPSLFSEFSQHRLVLIGDGPERPKLEGLTNSLGINKQTNFLGFQPQEQIISWMQRAKLLVLPSLEEAQGVVLLEALACGTPIVASQVDGIPEVITPDVGLLVPPAAPAALAEAIKSLLSNPQLWAEMSHQARQRAIADYGWDRAAAKIVALYKSVLKNQMSSHHDRNLDHHP
jgi:glycosyltransferase involved in cell wall biosynthesis